MNNFKAYKAYQNTQAQTNSPLRANILAYEWCLKNLNFVRLKYSEMRYSEADDRLINTEQIFRELRLGLTTEDNFIPEETREQVLEHSNNIRMLYDWFIEEINHMYATKQTENLEKMMKCIQDLLDADRFAEQQYFKEQQNG